MKGPSFPVVMLMFTVISSEWPSHSNKKYGIYIMVAFYGELMPYNTVTEQNRSFLATQAAGSFRL